MYKLSLWRFATVIDRSESHSVIMTGFSFCMAFILPIVIHIKCPLPNTKLCSSFIVDSCYSSLFLWFLFRQILNVNIINWTLIYCLHSLFCSGYNIWFPFLFKAIISKNTLTFKDGTKQEVKHEMIVSCHFDCKSPIC